MLIIVIGAIGSPVVVAVGAPVVGPIPVLLLHTLYYDIVECLWWGFMVPPLGTVCGVNEETAYSWIVCEKCGGDKLKEDGWENLHINADSKHAEAMDRHFFYLTV